MKANDDTDLEFLWCYSFPGGRNCCLSCHEDHEEWGYDLMEVEFGGMRIGLVCCTVSIWLDDTGLAEWLDLD